MTTMPKLPYYLFVGSHSTNGGEGIYTVSLDGEPLLPLVSSVHGFFNSGAFCASPDGSRLYVGTEGMVFHGRADGGITSFDILPDGTLKETGHARSHGQRTCALAITPDGKEILGVNFFQGTLVACPVAENGAVQEARLVVAPSFVPAAEPGHPPRIALHGVCSVEGRYIGVISTAEMALILFDAKDGRRVASYPFEGAHARYVVYRGGYFYCLMQDPGDIYVLKNCLDQDGSVHLVQKISCQEPDYPKTHRIYAMSVLRITPDGSLVFAATRFASTVTVFRRDAGSGMLVRSSIAALPGDNPRDLAVSPDGTLLAVANQFSSDVSIHTIDYKLGTLGRLVGTVPVSAPAALIFAGGQSA